MSLITAKNINFTRHGKAILQNVSLEITKEDFTTIVGPNGAGKSSLLKCLLGFYKIDSGEIIKSKNLKIGYVPQSLNLEQRMPINVRRFLTLGNKFKKDDILEAIEEVKISNILDKPIYTLSGGELRRILLARSLLINPELLVLDEPAQNLDIAGQLSFYKLLKDIYNKKKLSIVMVSHDLHMVMANTKKVICLFGHICCSGSPNIITKDPEFVSIFGSDMAKMMAIYNHEHTHKHV
jgi:zinc transport system ATP-binding protein